MLSGRFSGTERDLISNKRKKITKMSKKWQKNRKYKRGCFLSEPSFYYLFPKKQAIKM